MANQPQQPNQKELETEIRKELESHNFPSEFIHDDFWMHAKKALRNQSIPSIRTDFNTYENIDKWVELEKETISLYEISFLINCVVSTTPKQFEELEPDYIRIQRNANNLLIKWNEIVNPIKEKTVRKMTAHIIRNIPMNGQSKFMK